MFSQEHLQSYRAAAGWAVQFEFLLRAIAQALWTEERGAAKDLKVMYDDIVQELQPHLTAGNLADLNAVNLCNLRDDIVHSRMSKAFGKLGGRNNDPSVASVTHIASGENPLVALTRLVRGEGIPIPKTKTEAGGVSMWLVQMAVSGSFSRAADAFKKGCEILDAALGARAEAQLKAASL